MANLINRWAEYDAGTLTPPVLVQVDQPYPTEYLIWVYTADGIKGPFSRSSFEATASLAEIVVMLTDMEEAANAEEALQ